MDTNQTQDQTQAEETQHTQQEQTQETQETQETTTTEQPQGAEQSKKQKKEKEKKPQQQSQQTQQQEDDPLKDNYGDYPLITSAEITERKWTPLHHINENFVGKDVLIRARLHNARVKGNLAFLVLREEQSTAQAAAFPGETVSKKMIKWINGISKESVIDVYAHVVQPEKEIQSCSVKQELQIKRLYVISRAAQTLPFQLEDAQRKLEAHETENDQGYDATYAQSQPSNKTEESKEDPNQPKLPVVTLKTRLDNRILDLRTTTNQAIFRISSAVCQLFREYLYKHDFMEIHTPKLIAGSSEGGANVFKLPYFEKQACLAQSPQLYKQMCVMADFERVFEIGPVFRAEKSFTHRHMTEFTGLDVEMTIKEHYFEVLDVFGDMFAYICNGLETRYARELATIQQQYPFEPFKCKTPVVKLTFQEGVELLQKHGINQKPDEDLDTHNERELGRIVRQEYDTDFYMLHRYPVSARPFYTMICQDDPNYTNSYDFFMRGEEITSGAQRIHDPEFLAERAKVHGIDVETIRDYINAFSLGAKPHAGCGIGLERVVMLYCNLGDIRKSCLFPRDPKRITP